MAITESKQTIVWVSHQKNVLNVANIKNGDELENTSQEQLELEEMSDILQLKSINEELFAVRDAYKIGIYKLKIRTNLQ